MMSTYAAHIPLITLLSPILRSAIRSPSDAPTIIAIRLTPTVAGIPLHAIRKPLRYNSISSPCFCIKYAYTRHKNRQLPVLTPLYYTSYFIWILYKIQILEPLCYKIVISSVVNHVLKTCVQLLEELLIALLYCKCVVLSLPNWLTYNLCCSRLLSNV